jgi:hypothetical protein
MISEGKLRVPAIWESGHTSQLFKLKRGRCSCSESSGDAEKSCAIDVHDVHNVHNVQRYGSH